MMPKAKIKGIIVLSILAVMLTMVLVRPSGLSDSSSLPSRLFFLNFDKKSPADHIKENQIYVYPDRIVIFLENATLSKYAPTGSMDPVLDHTANGIEIRVEKPEDIQEGDIITFKKDNELIVHRVVEIGHDKIGWYCITQGDNNPQSDGKIRFSDIVSTTVILVY